MAPIVTITAAPKEELIAIVPIAQPADAKHESMASPTSRTLKTLGKEERNKIIIAHPFVAEDQIEEVPSKLKFSASFQDMERRIRLFS